jgi:nicotinate-nucleotide adenylyltransferase
MRLGKRTPGRVRHAALSAAALERALGGRRPGPGTRIGLLGGSFNPTHDGHLDLSKTALVRLALDEVWWLVSPQNPLKPTDDMASLDQRVAQACASVDHPQIRVTALEAELGTRYSVDTIKALKRHFPKVDFVWLIGADNLIQLPDWKDWEQLFRQVAIAVFARPGYSRKALAGKPARLFADCRVAERRADQLAVTPPPSWVFIHGPLNPSSSTAIRKKVAGHGET